MRSQAQPNHHFAVQDASFTKTHWSWVFSAIQKDSAEAESALARLCERYWYPLYVYLRRLGHDHGDAQDLVQSFFAKLIEKDYLQSVHPEKGRFRTFLLMMLNRFRMNEWDRVNRQKRGGGVQIFSLSGQEGDAPHMAEPVDGMTPEKAYEIRWAMLLLNRVLDRLEEELSGSGKAGLFEGLKIFLTGEKSDTTYAEIAQGLGMSVVNVKVTVHRLRQRYREILREEIAETVDTPDAIEDEIRHLFTALS